MMGDPATRRRRGVAPNIENGNGSGSSTTPLDFTAAYDPDVAAIDPPSPEEMAADRDRRHRESLGRLRAEVAQDQWRPGDNGRGTWDDQRGRWVHYMADPDTGEFVLDGDGNRMPLFGAKRTIDARIADEPHVLELVVEAVQSAGFSGEARLVKLLYLALTTRLLDRIVSMAVKGPSASGKSHLVATVLRLFPDTAYWALSAMSERALVYDTTDLRHRFLVLYEAAGLTGDIQTYLVRSLLSEGRVRYTTVDRSNGGPLGGRSIEREGPTGLITTTTSLHLHPENETRLLSVTLSDSPDQTREVLRAQARGPRPEVDLEEWRRFQELLAHGPTMVRVPYAETLADAIPPVSVRLRRDFPTMLSLIKAHALVHQNNRDRDADGAIRASMLDYEAVRELVADLFAEAAGAGVPETIRETVDVSDHG